jgi:hypothetical protein
MHPKIALAFALSLVACGGSKVDLSGVYTGTVVVSLNPPIGIVSNVVYNVTLTLQQSGGSVSGTFVATTTSSFATPMVSGTASGPVKRPGQIEPLTVTVGNVAAGCTPSQFSASGNATLLQEDLVWTAEGQITCTGQTIAVTILSPGSLHRTGAGGTDGGTSPDGGAAGDGGPTLPDPCGVAGDWVTRCPAGSTCSGCAEVTQEINMYFTISQSIAAGGGSWTGNVGSYSFDPATCMLTHTFTVSNPCFNGTRSYTRVLQGGGGSHDEVFTCWSGVSCICQGSHTCTDIKLGGVPDGGTDGGPPAATGAIQMTVTCGGSECGKTGNLYGAVYPLPSGIPADETKNGVTLSSTAPIVFTFTGLSPGSWVAHAYLCSTVAGTQSSMGTDVPVTVIAGATATVTVVLDMPYGSNCAGQPP